MIDYSIGQTCQLPTKPKAGSLVHPSPMAHLSSIALQSRISQNYHAQNILLSSMSKAQGPFAKQPLLQLSQLCFVSQFLGAVSFSLLRLFFIVPVDLLFKPEGMEITIWTIWQQHLDGPYCPFLRHFRSLEGLTINSYSPDIFIKTIIGCSPIFHSFLTSPAKDSYRYLALMQAHCFMQVIMLVCFAQLAFIKLVAVRFIQQL